MSLGIQELCRKKYSTLVGCFFFLEEILSMILRQCGGEPACLQPFLQTCGENSARDWKCGVVNNTNWVPIIELYNQLYTLVNKWV